MKNRPIIFAPLALLLALTGGCTQVKPWQRGTLADPIMQADRDPLGSALLDHIYFSREAATGGRTVAGAGCGCN
ncbi:MAG: lipoprotein [Phycisphaerales bacterium]|nr:lipoprotein [Phycisphaerales bacterium]